MSDELKYELIEKVRSFPAIWNKNHDQHHNRYILHQRWKRIAQQLGVKELDIKKIWRNLRQEFGKQVKRIQKSGREALETANPPWPYYHSLLFLKEQFISADNTSSITEQDQEVSDTYDDLQEDYNYELDGMSEPMRSPSDLSETSPRRENGPYSGYKKMTSRDSMEMAFVEMERERLEMQRRQEISETVRDEDVGFFNSLLPHVRQLQPQQKMMFRLKVQHQLYELLYGPYDPHQSLPYLSSSNQGDPICAAVYSNG